MGKKWQKIDPAEIKVGDRVKVATFNQPTVIGKVTHLMTHYDYTKVHVGGVYMFDSDSDDRTWYVRKPKPAKDTYYAELEVEVKALKAERDELRSELDELDAVLLGPVTQTRPDEPPLGTFFRVDRTGDAFQRCVGDGDWCYLILGDSDRASDLETWGDITEPGDTITLLDLVERES